MHDTPEFVEHLRQLAQEYRNKHMSLETKYREMTSAADFLAELKQREAALVERFRKVQQLLLTSLKDDELKQVLELSSIFDEIRIVNQFTIQTLGKVDSTPDDGIYEG
ncbi:MAG: hypothetical protein JSU72_09650 [Deltaproteobacteria bacterium]|nr:MAG: hypothetical protein JSU72_09650 [Deltaproteobacteria bacterium]